LGGGEFPVAELDPLGHLLHRLQQPQPRRQLGQLLGEERGADRLSGDEPAVGRLGDPGEQPEQGGLAGTVGAQQRHPVAGADVPVDAGEDRLVARGEGDVGQLVHLLAEAGGSKALQGHRVTGLGNIGDQGVGRVDAELRLAGPRRWAPTQPGDLLAEQVLPARLHGGRDPQPLGARQGPRGVPALVDADRLVGDLPGTGGDRVEEPAVVGDHSQRPTAGEQVPGQPVDTRDVQVVGGLVEDQQVGGADQQRGQRHPPPLASGHGVDGGVEPQVGHAQPVQDQPDLG
jgi:hypothetical protein